MLCLFCAHILLRELWGKGMERPKQNLDTIPYHFITISSLHYHPLENPLSHSQPPTLPTSFHTHTRACLSAAYLLSRLSLVVTTSVKLFKTWQTELIPLSLAAHKLCWHNRIVPKHLPQRTIMSCLLICIFHYILTSLRKVIASYSFLNPPQLNKYLLDNIEFPPPILCTVSSTEAPYRVPWF